MARTQSKQRRLKSYISHNMFSRKRDKLADNSLKVFVSGNYLITDNLLDYKIFESESVSKVLGEGKLAHIQLPNIDLKNSLLSYSTFWSLDTESLEKTVGNSLGISHSFESPGSSQGMNSQIIPSIIPMLTTMQFPFYSAAGIYLAKNTFKVGISTNLPVWLLSDIQYSSINGKVSFGSESLKLFTSFAALKNYVKRNADSYSFWSKTFMVVSLLVFAWTAFRVYKNLKRRRGEHDQPAQAAAQAIGY